MSNKGKRILEFKEVRYDFDNLIYLYCDSDKDEFKEGFVTNLETGEEFDINNLPDIYIEMNEGLLNESLHLTYEQRSRLRRILNPKMVLYREKILEKKLEEDTISKEELEEYILIVDRRDIKIEFDCSKGIKADLITKFVKLNQEIPLPRGIGLVSIGRYYRLLELLLHKNKIYKKPHGNSREPSKKELMEYLECNSANTFRTFIQDLEKYNIARRFKLPNNRNIIFINPIYAHKDLIISKELYNVFKDVLEMKLDKRILKYMEFIYQENNEVDGSITYQED